MEKEVKRTKSSWYIDPYVLEAMNVVKQEVGIPISRQIETGAVNFLKENHEDLLKEYNLDVWNR